MQVDAMLERLAAFGIPSALHQFTGTKKNPTPDPPFNVYFYTSTTRGADLAPVSILQADFVIELYTEKPDDAIIAQFEAAVVPDVEYKKFQAPIQGENLIQTAYEFTFTQKLKRSV